MLKIFVAAIVILLILIVLVSLFTGKFLPIYKRPISRDKDSFVFYSILAVFIFLILVFIKIFMKV
ncbi:hypothetical protein CJA_0977 [Cellvibrio japonicus Ueda107]|uniref:Uncharacterized protein n=1 Tax=Cellvibrio japonicus (strain Ueda107) TaxID=498211 RepID=B3PLF3_CELJU|nr:hypothetical protein CJA_0977 [Cellvibrio japonicus Ueda107]